MTPPSVKVDDALLPKEGKSRTAIFDPELKRLRAIRMMEARAAGHSIREVAEMFRVSDDTVQRTLTYARRAGILVEHSDTILQRMVPLAETAIIDALKSTEVDILSKAQLGMKLYEGVGLLGNKGKPSGALDGDNDLAKAMQELRQKAELYANTTEGELVSGSPQRFLPDGPVSTAADAGKADVQQPAAGPPGASSSSDVLDPRPPATPSTEDVEADAEGGAAESELPG